LLSRVGRSQQFLLHIYKFIVIVANQRAQHQCAISSRLCNHFFLNIFIIIVSVSIGSHPIKIPRLLIWKLNGTRSENRKIRQHAALQVTVVLLCSKFIIIFVSSFWPFFNFFFDHCSYVDAALAFKYNFTQPLIFSFNLTSFLRILFFRSI